MILTAFTHDAYIHAYSYDFRPRGIESTRADSCAKMCVCYMHVFMYITLSIYPKLSVIHIILPSHRLLCAQGSSGRSATREAKRAALDARISRFAQGLFQLTSDKDDPDTKADKNVLFGI
jgi:hypothetical protein